MEATVGFAASLEAWSEIEANPWFRTLSKNAVSPAVKDVVKAQADATTNVGNIAVYEGTTMDETAQEYIMSVQMMAKAQANAKKKADALSKLDGPKRAKAEAADLTVSTHARTHAQCAPTRHPLTHASEACPPMRNTRFLSYCLSCWYGDAVSINMPCEIEARKIALFCI